MWGGVSLGAFEVAAELPLIECFAVANMVFDFVILIDGIKSDDFALMEPSACKPFTDNCVI